MTTSKVDKALEIFNAGFNSKADLKKALGYLGREYDGIRERIMHHFLDEKRARLNKDKSNVQIDPRYWVCPNYLHLWNEKKFVEFAEFPNEIAEIKELIELREAFKAAEIVKPVKSDSKAKKEAILSDIKDELAKRKESYLNGIEMTKHFGNLYVRVNAHLVTNEYGTTFVRHFFYLFGKLTPLNLIIAIAEATKKERGEE